LPTKKLPLRISRLRQNEDDYTKGHLGKGSRRYKQFMSEKAKTPKHVIILGAGASANSGYPQANELRLWMSSRQSILKKIEGVIVDGGSRVVALKHFNEWIQPAGEALNLFRNGAFATLDEFCKLSGQKLQSEVEHLKKILRLALSIQNPEGQYDKSDYYRFIQKLFKADLVDVREDIVVLSFNYDVYLEFLLRRAVTVREGVTKTSSKTNQDLLTSGFFNRNTDLLENSDEFCLLKLHGALAWPQIVVNSGQKERDQYCCYGDLFDGTDAQRIQTLTGTEIGTSVSPIVFPWEIMNDDGSFIEEASFPALAIEARFSKSAGGHNGTTTMFQLFKSIWTRARAEVQAANKISIVGLSLHEYMRPAFQFLFGGKAGNTELVVADKCLSKFKDYEDSAAHFDPLSPVARIDQWLRIICPNLRWNEKEHELVPSIVLPGDQKNVRRPIRIRKSFEEFILNEIDMGFVPNGIIQLPSIIESK
jgi:hypothetical protein